MVHWQLVTPRIACLLIALGLAAAPLSGVKADDPPRASAQTTFAQADLKGTWFFYVDMARGTGAAILSCKVRVGPGKKVAAGQDLCFIWDVSFGSDIRDIQTGGTLRITKAGAVSGSFAVNTTTYDFNEARMSRDKNVIRGVGENGFGALFSFSGVKR